MINTSLLNKIFKESLKFFFQNCNYFFKMLISKVVETDMIKLKE